jgi:hypothetical protein
MGTDHGMKNLGVIAGALAIMMGSGTIIDFELYDSDGELFVRVWAPGGCDISQLRKHVAVLLARRVDERHVMMVGEFL